MATSRTVLPPATPRSPSARRKWLLRSALAVVIAGGAAGGWYWNRESERAAERERVLLRSKEYRVAAADEVERYVRDHPDDAEVLRALVEQHLRLNLGYARVEPHLARLIELQPADPEPLRVRFALRTAHGFQADALADGLRILELAPDDHQVRGLVANLAMNTGRPDAAIPALQVLAAAQPQARGEWGTLLAKAYWEAGDIAKAQEALDRYAPRDSDAARAGLVRGILHAAQNRPEQAIPCLRHAAERPVERSVALFHLAAALRAAGREEEAKQVLADLDAVKARERLLVDARQRPADLPLQVRAARAMLAEGRPNDAAVLLEEAIRTHGEHPDIREPIAQAYRELGRPELADLWLKAKK